jgi:two-component system, NtrC family, C4-dicarboxylate transport response regulator DctD
MKPRILLVEDDEFIGPLVKTVLSSAGYEVEVAGKLEDVKTMDPFGFSAVISDFQLPGADGCDVIDYMRSKAPGIPAMLISGYGNWAAENCANRGMENVQHLEKPFRADQLLHRVEALLPTGACPEK